MTRPVARRLRPRWFALSVLLLGAPRAVQGAPWKEDDAFSALENAGLLANEVDAADLDGDGTIDLVFANVGPPNEVDLMGGGEAPQAFLNAGGGAMIDADEAVFGVNQFIAGGAVKLRDIDRDGDNDIIFGAIYEQSRLFINNGGGSFSDETAINLPQMVAGVGDIEVGDVDGDGDLDLVLANWGGEVLHASDLAAGGVTLLWSQIGDPTDDADPGSGMFEDLTSTNMPDIKLRWSWDLELVDLDNDWDLDIAISCFACDEGRSIYLFSNDGSGVFSSLPVDDIQGFDAYGVKSMNLDGDEFLDLVTLSDGPIPDLGFAHRVLRNDGNGGFVEDLTIWPFLENPSSNDPAAAFYDHDSDGDPDLVLGGKQEAFPPPLFPDRLMINDGGTLAQWDDGGMPQFQALEHALDPSYDTYDLVLADLTGDHKLDIAMAQYVGEKLVFFATDEVAADTAAPVFVNVEQPASFDGPGAVTLRVRCHDNKSPLMLHDFEQTVGFPYIESWLADPGPDPDTNPGDKSAPGQWYGEYLWRIPFDVPATDVLYYRYCASDAAQNGRCTAVTMATVMEPAPDTTTTGTDTGTSSSTGVTTGPITTTGTTAGPAPMTGTGGNSSASPTDPTTGTDTTAAPESSGTPSPPSCSGDAGAGGGVCVAGDESACICSHRGGDRPGALLLATCVGLCRRRRRILARPVH